MFIQDKSISTNKQLKKTRTEKLKREGQERKTKLPSLCRNS